jgi:hypothetical protein
MHLWPIIGLVGDLLTFTGGLLLAIDVAQKEREFSKIKAVSSSIESPFLAKIKIEMDGIILTDKDDVVRAFIHHSARKAFWGCILLSVGFLFLLSVRISELQN